MLNSFTDVTDKRIIGGLNDVKWEGHRKENNMEKLCAWAGQTDAANVESTNRESKHCDCVQAFLFRIVVLHIHSSPLILLEIFTSISHKLLTRLQTLKTPSDIENLAPPNILHS
jgi:hypothetical protein